MTVKDRPRKQPDSQENPYYYGFDYLRAIMALGVLAYHIRIFGQSNLFDINEYMNHKITLSDLFNFHFCKLTVPVFFLVSIFLFLLKGAGGNFRYFAQRIEKLIYLYLFWVGVVLLFYGAAGYFSNIWPKNFGDAVLFIVSGGYSAFYFFFSLIFLTLLSLYAIRLPVFVLWVLLTATGLFLGAFPVIVNLCSEYDYLIAFWSPLNFPVYAFAAALVWKYKMNGLDLSARGFNVCIIVSLVVFVLGAILEWKYLIGVHSFKYDGSALPSLTRISVVAGAVSLFLLSFRIKHKPNRIIRLLSDYSLGIYCLHPFLILAYEKAFGPIDLYQTNVGKFFIVLLISALSSVLLRRAFRRGLI